MNKQLKEDFELRGKELISLLCILMLLAGLITGFVYLVFYLLMLIFR